MKNRRPPSRGGAAGGKPSRDSARGGPARPPQKGARPPSRSPHQGAPRGGGSPQRSSTNEAERIIKSVAGRWVTGIHSCEEVFKVRPRAIQEVWLREKYDDSQQLRALFESAKHFGVRVSEKPTGTLDKVGSGHQGIALVVSQSPELDWEKLKSLEHATILILDGIEDPHNLGSILRTSWLTGVSAIFIPADRAVGLTPSVCKVASGGAEHIPVESFPNLASALQKLKEIGFWIYGLSEKGERKPWDFKLGGKVAWVIGSEGSGMRITTERACDELVRIPQVATGSSYNAAVAAAMALTETCRQRGLPK
jgi:23S rRNA (guanosine2251-2'-O)-methyltransferase